MRPDFSKINFRQHKDTDLSSSDSEKQPITGEDWMTPEHIQVNPLYTKNDLKGLEHLDYAAGVPPFLRGPYSTMYVMKPWTIRMPDEVVEWIREKAAMESIKRKKNVSMNTVAVEALTKAMKADRKRKS